MSPSGSSFVQRRPLLLLPLLPSGVVVTTLPSRALCGCLCLRRTPAESLLPRSLQWCLCYLPFIFQRRHSYLSYLRGLPSGTALVGPPSRRLSSVRRLSCPTVLRAPRSLLRPLTRTRLLSHRPVPFRPPRDPNDVSNGCSPSPLILTLTPSPTDSVLRSLVPRVRDRHPWHLSPWIPRASSSSSSTPELVRRGGCEITELPVPIFPLRRVNPSQSRPVDVTHRLAVVSQRQSYLPALPSTARALSPSVGPPSSLDPSVSAPTHSSRTFTVETGPSQASRPDRPA